MYELFDEVMDFGYPQFTEAKIMADYIKTDAHKADVHDVKQSMAVTNAVSWRSEGLKYKVCALVDNLYSALPSQLTNLLTRLLLCVRPMHTSEKRGVSGRARVDEPACEQQRPCRP